MPFLPTNRQRTKVNSLHCTSPSQGKIPTGLNFFDYQLISGVGVDGDATILTLHLLSDANTQEPLEVIEGVSQPTMSNHWLNLRQWCRPVKVIHLILFFLIYWLIRKTRYCTVKLHAIGQFSLLGACLWWNHLLNAFEAAPMTDSMPFRAVGQTDGLITALFTAPLL